MIGRPDRRMDPLWRWTTLAIVYAAFVALVEAVPVILANGWPGQGLWRLVLLEIVAALNTALVIHLPLAVLAWGSARRRPIAFWIWIPAALALYLLRDRWLGPVFDADGVGRLVDLDWALVRDKFSRHGGKIAAAVVVGALGLFGPLLLSRLDLPRPTIPRRAGRPALFMAVVILAATLALNVAARRGRPAGPDIILISLDTLRADHLGCYGHDLPTTPHLDAFADGATLFETCYAQSAWTLTSHMSMLTSLYPARHGVSDDRALSPKVTTLAERLRDAGYATLGFARRCLWMDARFGFDQGFQVYEVNSHGEDGMAQNRFLDPYLSRRDRPLFLFLHYFDVHSDFDRLPYDAPARLRERFCAHYTGDFDGGMDGHYASEFIHYANRNGIVLPPADRDYVRSLYDAGVAYQDEIMADLWARLDRHGLLDDAIVIVTADHGEEFQEHGHLGHGNRMLHDELLHVPLIVKLPGGAPQTARVGDLVELVDLMPTVLELAGVSIPDDLQGRDLGPLLVGDAAEPKTHIFAQHFKSFTVGDRRWRLLTKRLDEPERFRLFDREADPGETADVIAEHPELAEQLRLVALARAQADSLLAGEDVEMSPEDERLLRALGYL